MRIPLLIGPLEATLNHYLSLDEEVDVLLAPLAGKVIAVELLPAHETLYFCPTTDNIQLLEQSTQKTDVRICGTLSSLGLMGFSATPMRSIFSGEVSIEGDTQTAHAFQQLFAKLNIDLEAKLAQFTGAAVAHEIGDALRNTASWTKTSVATFKRNSEEFLQEETRDLPAIAEANIFYQQVDAIRSDFDRLAARVAQLKPKPKN